MQYERRSVLVLLLAVPLLPVMVSITRIERLQSLSLAALVLDLLFVGFIVVQFGKHGAEAGSGHYWTDGPSSAVGMLNAIAIISLSFTCHFNIIPIWVGLKQPKAITAVITWSTVANTFLYAAVGLIAFFAHPTRVSDDILDDYAGFEGVDVFRVFVVVAMVITFPLIGFEGQHAFQALALGGTCGRDAALCSSSSSSSSSSNGASRRAGRAADPTYMTPRTKHVIACTVYTMLAITVAAAVSDTGAMIALVGAACGIPIMYILPPLLYLKAASNATHAPPSMQPPSEAMQKAARPAARKGAAALLVLGVLVCIACIVSSILGFK